MERLSLKWQNARTHMPSPKIWKMENAKIGIISMGSADPAVVEARDQLLKLGYPTDYLRVRAIPFSTEVQDFISSHERVYVVEINRDGQLKQLLTIEYPEIASRLKMVAHVDGLALSAKWVREAILAQEVEYQ